MTISVIIPCYNHGHTIRRCIDAVFAQTHEAIEIIVVNDGSTDDSARVLATYHDHVKVITQENRGGPAARNRGFMESKGDFVIFCDADVILHGEAIEKMLFALDAHPEAAYAYSSFRFGWKMFPLWTFDAEKLKKMNYIHTTSLIRRADFHGFDESLKRFQDWDLWLTLLERGRVGVWVPEDLFHVVTKGGGISHWAPSFLYRLPWARLGYKPRVVGDYESAADIVRRKHHLV